MLISMAVLLVPIVLITWFFTREPAEPPLKVIDWQQIVATANQETSAPLFTPSDVPSSWRATSGYWVKQGATLPTGKPALTDMLVLGFLDDRNVHLGFHQQLNMTPATLKELTREGYKGDVTTIAGREWTRYTSGDGRTQSLVTKNGPYTVLLVADGDVTLLDNFAALLK